MHRHLFGSAVPRVTRLAIIVVLVAACGDDADKRPLGASCTEARECESGRCVASECVDPRLLADGTRYYPIVAYVTRDNVGDNISVVTLADDGTLAEHPGSPFSTGVGNATEIAFTPDGAHAYIGGGSNGQVGVHVLDLDPTEHTPRTNPYPPFETSSGLRRWDAVVIHPAGEYVFAADAESDGDRVWSFRIDTELEPGRLIQIDTNVAIFDVAWLEMDPRGRFLIAANEDREFGIFDLEASGALDGTLDDAVERAAPDFIRSIRFGADGESVYLMTATGLHAYDFDRADQSLTEVVGSPFEVAGGRVLAIDPLGRFMHEGGDQGIFVHRINPTGTVALVDIDDDPLNGLTGYPGLVSDLSYDATGDLLYATGAATASFAVTAEGLLKPIASVAVEGDRIGVLSLAR